MTNQQLDIYKQKLLERLRTLKQYVRDMRESAQRSRLDVTGDLTNIPTHIADISADTFAQDLTLGFIENKGEVIAAIESALERIENKTYGICENCGQAISEQRLQTLPQAKFCLDCKMEMEKRTQPITFF